MSGGDVEATDSPADLIWHTGEHLSVLPEPSLPVPPKSSTGEPSSPRGPLWAVTAGYASVTVGLLVLVGWAFGIETFKSVLPNSMTMKPNTAVSLLALGLSMIFAVVTRAPYVPGRKRILAARAFAMLPLIIGLLTIIEYSASVDLGIDQLLFRQAVIERGGPFPGRISPATSTAIILLGISFLLLDAKSPRLRRVSQWPALISATISFVAVLGYLYGAEQLYQIRPYASVALHTALTMVVLGVGF